MVFWPRCPASFYTEKIFRAQLVNGEVFDPFYYREEIFRSYETANFWFSYDSLKCLILTSEHKPYPTDQHGRNV